MAKIMEILEAKPNGWRNVLAIHYLGREVEQRQANEARVERFLKARARRTGETCPPEWPK